MSIKRINVPVTGDAKQILLDYQLDNKIPDQGWALTELLTEFKKMKSGDK